MKFIKMHAAGNDYVYAAEGENKTANFPLLAKKLCDRRFGIGADGIITVDKDETGEGDFFMRIYNADGSEGKTCGNGLRCAAAYALLEGLSDSETIKIRTLSACHKVTLSKTKNGFFARADFPSPKFAEISKNTDNIIKNSLSDYENAEYFVVDNGNLHLVVFGAEESAEKLAEKVNSTGVFKDGINVESAKFGDDEIMSDVFERGSGTTFSCGSGAVATAFAAQKILRTDYKKYPIEMRGGTLFVEIGEEKCYLSGEIIPVFKGETF